MTRPEPGRKRGSILLLSLFFMFILFLLAVTLFNLVPSDLHAADRSRRGLMGHYVANAGVQAAVAWLTQCMGNYQVNNVLSELPDDPDVSPSDQLYQSYWNATNDNPSAPNVVDSAWGWTCKIAPDSTRNDDVANFMPKVYNVTATAYFWGKPYRIAHVTLEQASFAGYAMFMDKWPAGQVWNLGSGGVNGPVHSNTYLVLRVPDSNYWNSASNPYFWGPRSQVTISQKFVDSNKDGDGLAYIGGNASWTGGTPSPTATNWSLVPYAKDGDTGRYYSMLQRGRESLQVKRSISLPSGTTNLAYRAWDGSSGSSLPKQPKGADGNPQPTVWVNNSGGKVNGGIYIQGDVQSMDLRLDSNGNQVVQIQQGVATPTTKPKYGWIPWPGHYKTKKVDLGTQTKHKNYVHQPATVPNMVPVQHKVVTYPSGGIGEPVVSWVNTIDPSTGQVEMQQKGTKPGPWVWDGTYYYTENYKTVNTDQLQYHWAPTGETYTAYPQQPAYTKVWEVTSDKGAKVTVDGKDYTATKGQTMVEDASGNVKIYNGLLNGTIFDEGNIKGLHGIVKGSATEDASGKLTYHNKTIAVDTGNNQQININGDLLQFSQSAFDSLSSGAKANFDNLDTRNSVDAAYWKGAALNADDSHTGTSWNPATSPNSNNALGLIAHDVYVNGHSDWGKPIDIYAVILAGRTDKYGNSTGGFGTGSWYLTHGTGSWRVIGGIIQAQPKPWVQGSNGDTGSLWYDEEASKQKFFPTYASFQILRYVEVPANGD